MARLNPKQQCLGINASCQQEILSIHIMLKESESGWLEMINDLKSRGVNDIIFYARII